MVTNDSTPKGKKADVRKESIFSKVYGYEVKEDESGNLVRGGYIATTHLDSGFYDVERQLWVKDQISKETLDSWATELNNGNPRTNKASINHNRESHVAGVAIKGSVKVDSLSDGEYGLYADVIVDKTKENFDDTKYRLDNGLLDSFSIEFTTKDPMSDNYIEGAVSENESDGGIIRTLLPNTQLEGFTLASQPMNEHAVMIKEVKDKSHTDTKESVVIDEKIIVQDKEVKKMTNNKEVKEVKEEAPAEPASELSSEVKELLELGKQAKEKLSVEAKEKEFLEIKTKIKEDLKEELNNVKVEEKVAVDNPSNVEAKEFVEFKEATAVGSRLEVGAQFKLAAKSASMAGLIDDDGWVKTTVKSMKKEFNVVKSESKTGCGAYLMEMKSLGITTNQNTDANYLLSAAELADVFDPVIFNALNQDTVTWNLLAKEDFSQKGNNQVQFTLKTAANTSAAAYTGNAVALGTVTRIKYMTKFKKYQAGVCVDGDMMAAARGGPVGDVFAQEVQDSTVDLLQVINQAIFRTSTNGAEADANIISFEYVTDNATNGTLYNVARTSANKLAPASNGDTYIDGTAATISFDNLRSLKRNATENEGAQLSNLVFITSFTQGDKLRGKYDAAQRLVPTSSRFGFEGRPEFDGIPVFEDRDCNNDDWFLIDMETVRAAIWVPPTLEMLGKDSDSQKGFIKTYFAIFYRAPRRIGQIYNNAT